MPLLSPEIRILVVDDEGPVRLLVRECLEEAGFHTGLAPDGNSALAMLARESFDLVISDVKMPGMSGLELIAEVSRRHPDTGVLLLTGCDDVAMAVAAMKTGALDYILKPFDPAQIVASVRSAIDRRNVSREKALHLFLLEETINQRTVELTKTLSSLDDASQITLDALVTALDARERETHAHSHRVSEYTQYLARLLGVNGAELGFIQRGAMLHDIGKIGISDSILLKPGELTEVEWIEMKRHPQIGQWILDGVEALRPASGIVLSHHEKFDGSGYPRNLAGDAIPLGARIFSVVDSLDAMTSDRPYRKGAPYLEARNEILRFRGSQFDPRVVECFLSVDPEVWDEIRRRVNAAKYRPLPELAACF